MSRRNLIRRFKAATGHLPGAYLQMLRVEAARRMLEEGAPSIERVAREVGYDDPAFFRCVFRRYTGLAPAAYRDRFRLQRT
jgi:transcriptional regulator GlxA family with amidase domain